MPIDPATNHGDEADRANAMTETYFALAALDNLARRSNLPGRLAVHCIDCGEEIDIRRLAVIDGPLRCAGCQRLFDSGNSHLS